MQFAVWLSVVDFVTVYIFFFYLYINRIVSNNFYCNTVSQKAKEGGSGGGKIGTLTRKEPFSCALKTRLFPSSLRFFNILFCSVFVTLIILTCYFCLCVCLWVWVCVFLFVFGKIDYDIKKQQFLGEENMFLINTSTVYNNICSYYAQFSSEYKSSQTLHWFCDFFLLHHHRLYILSWCSPLSHWEGRLSRSFSFDFVSFLYGNYYSSFCVYLCESMLLSF